MDEITGQTPQQSTPAYWAVIPSAVRYDDTLRPNAKLLYGEISALANAHGYCFATNRYFAENYGFNIKTVGSLIGSLARSGYITIEIVRGEKGNVELRKIWLTGKALFLCPPPHQKADTPSPSKKGDPPPQKVEENNTRINNITPIAPKTVTDLLTDYAGDDAALRDALFGFTEMRAKKRKPIATARTVELLTAKLDKLSGGSSAVKVAMLDEATEKGWSSVFAPKGDFGAAPAKKGGGDDAEW